MAKNDNLPADIQQLIARAEQDQKDQEKEKKKANGSGVAVAEALEQKIVVNG